MILILEEHRAATAEVRRLSALRVLPLGFGADLREGSTIDRRVGNNRNATARALVVAFAGRRANRCDRTRACNGRGLQIHRTRGTSAASRIAGVGGNHAIDNRRASDGDIDRATTLAVVVISGHAMRHADVNRLLGIAIDRRILLGRAAVRRIATRTIMRSVIAFRRDVNACRCSKVERTAGDADAIRLIRLEVADPIPSSRLLVAHRTGLRMRECAALDRHRARHGEDFHAGLAGIDRTERDRAVIAVVLRPRSDRVSRDIPVTVLVGRIREASVEEDGLSVHRHAERPVLRRGRLVVRAATDPSVEPVIEFNVLDRQCRRAARNIRTFRHRADYSRVEGLRLIEDRRHLDCHRRLARRNRHRRRQVVLIVNPRLGRTRPREVDDQVLSHRSAGTRHREDAGEETVLLGVARIRHDNRRVHCSAGGLLVDLRAVGVDAVGGDEHILVRDNRRMGDEHLRERTLCVDVADLSLLAVHINIDRARPLDDRNRHRDLALRADRRVRRQEDRCRCIHRLRRARNEEAGRHRKIIRLHPRSVLRTVVHTHLVVTAAPALLGAVRVVADRHRIRARHDCRDGATLLLLAVRICRAGRTIEDISQINPVRRDVRSIHRHLRIARTAHVTLRLRSFVILDLPARILIISSLAGQRPRIAGSVYRLEPARNGETGMISDEFIIVRNRQAIVLSCRRLIDAPETDRRIRIGIHFRELRARRHAIESVTGSISLVSGAASHMPHADVVGPYACRIIIGNGHVIAIAHRDRGRSGEGRNLHPEDGFAVRIPLLQFIGIARYLTSIHRAENDVRTVRVHIGIVKPFDIRRHADHHRHPVHRTRIKRRLRLGGQGEVDLLLEIRDLRSHTKEETPGHHLRRSRAARVLRDHCNLVERIRQKSI